MGALCISVEANFCGKRIFLNSLEPLFNFSDIERPTITKPLIELSWSSYSGKIQLKVFGKGFGEEPFLRKVFPDSYI
jgi:hypothetical protein